MSTWQALIARCALALAEGALVALIVVVVVTR